MTERLTTVILPRGGVLVPGSRFKTYSRRGTFEFTDALQSDSGRLTIYGLNAGRDLIIGFSVRELRGVDAARTVRALHARIRGDRR